MALDFQVDTRRLPLAVEQNAQFHLTTQTHVNPLYGGKETRYAKRPPRVEASLVVGPNDAAEVIDMYRSQIGPRYAFTCRDWSDYEIVDQLLTPDTNGVYQVIKQYGSGIRLRNRIIYLVQDLVVKLDDVVVPSSEYDEDGGEITPHASPAAAWADGDVTVTCLFNFPARFGDSDQLDIEVKTGTLRVLRFDVVEVLG